MHDRVGNDCRLASGGGSRSPKRGRQTKTVPRNLGRGSAGDGTHRRGQGRHRAHLQGEPGGRPRRRQAQRGRRQDVEPAHRRRQSREDRRRHVRRRTLPRRTRRLERAGQRDSRRIHRRHHGVRRRTQAGRCALPQPRPRQILGHREDRHPRRQKRMAGHDLLLRPRHHAEPRQAQGPAVDAIAGVRRLDQRGRQPHLPEQGAGPQILRQAVQ